MNKGWSTLYRWIKFALSLFILLIMVEEIGALYGIAGWLGFYFVLAIITVIRQRKTVGLIMDRFQTVIWGKPLRFFSKEELKNTKVKVVWRKKKESKTL